MIIVTANQIRVFNEHIGMDPLSLSLSSKKHRKAVKDGTYDQETYHKQHIKNKFYNYEPYANNALEHALRAFQIARVLKVDEDNEPVESPLLQSVFNHQVYIICGPKEYGGAIKGHAFLGYLEYHCFAAQKQLDVAAVDIQNHAKTEFLVAHGIKTEEINAGVLAQINNTHVAIWQSFKGRALIAPTSGSFGIAAYETVDKLRKAEIKLNVGGKAKTINLLLEHEGGARAWAPNISTGIMSADKIEVLKNAANHVNLPVREWFVRETRDHFALLDALYHGDLFCPTNPKSPEEVAAILRNILYNEYKTKNGLQPIFEKGSEFARMYEDLNAKINRRDPSIIAALKSNDITVSYLPDGDIELQVSEPISAGIFGLMIGRLRHLEVLSKRQAQRGERVFDDTYEQPSVGATLAGAVVADSILITAAKKEITLSPHNKALLAELFPNLATAVEEDELPRMNIYCAPHMTNVALAEELRLGVWDNSQPTDGKSPNGLGTITTGQGPIDAIRNSPHCTLQHRCMPATNTYLPVAQALLFMHEIDVYGDKARFPEPAGATSLASCLKEYYKHNWSAQYLNGDKIEMKVYVSRLVFALRSNGIEREIFERILNPNDSRQNIWDYNPWDSIEQQAHLHGDDDIKFLRELKGCFFMSEEELVKQTGIAHSEEYRPRESKTFYDTGNNGMEKIAAELLPLIKQNRAQIIENLQNSGQLANEVPAEVNARKIIATTWALEREQSLAAPGLA